MGLVENRVEYWTLGEEDDCAGIMGPLICGGGGGCDRPNCTKGTRNNL